MRYKEESNRLVLMQDGTTLWIEPWGENAFRVRMTKEPVMDANDWALTEEIPQLPLQVTYETVDMTEPFYHTEEERKKHACTGTKITIQNGKIRAVINPEGVISYYNKKNELLTAEYWRNRNRIDRYCVPLRIDARELKPIIGTTDYTLTMRFEAFEDEKIFGMGQYQDGLLNKKGALLELAHRNSQTSIPFFISSRGYGFLWNNPAVGTVCFAANLTEWTAKNTKKLDYYITAGDTPAQIEEQYANVTGKVPMMPEFGMGFWQCKLRYRNQEELLAVAREYKKRNLPIDAIVIDFFHWSMQGDFQFDPVDWPDVEGMIKELHEMDIEPVVSVWPTIDERSKNYGEMAENGYLITSDRGLCVNMTWMGCTTFYDATNPDAQKFVWEQCKKNYYDKGIHCFWLDEAEPEYGPYDFDIYRYHVGPALSCSNIYPLMYAKGFYDGLQKEGQKDIINLVRCAWAGSQKYGVLTWSGDIHSSFRSMKEQIRAGLNMGLAGIPWWTTDIGGFLGGDNTDTAFRELLVRWFAWGVFSPVFRLHGERSPYYEREVEYRDGVRQFSSGQDNEIWSFGEENYEILKEFLLMRERLRPYIRKCMQEAHEKGTPVMRPLFYDIPEDSNCWEISDSYFFGPDLLVKPVTDANVTTTAVYLPEGHNWKEAKTGIVYEGGQTVNAVATLDVIPVFIKDQKDYPIYQ
ncbi:MAG: glycoside hydrolase family 31 protein [Butyribacter sp.]|nr:glycoside hydrolase family 31 protein [bacterium]MDY3855047.1 glycoside hydrolase family 31 protein [Butyribacter sp.]